jgi:8-oxo-dGTP diphosphatase
LTHKIDFPFEDGKNTKNAQFISLRHLPNLGFDHREIIQSTLAYLQEKIMYSDIAKPLFNTQFTLTELQTAYELILGKELNIRNFRKRMVDIGLVVSTGEMEIGVGHRPAQYFKFA